MSFRSRRTTGSLKNGFHRKLCIEPLEGRSLLAADFDLIGEFVANPQDRGSNPDFIGELNGSLLFTSDFKVWSSDGTASGTLELGIVPKLAFERHRFSAMLVGDILFQPRRAWRWLDCC